MPENFEKRADVTIAGYEAIVQQLEQLREYLCDSKKYIERGIHIPKGVLLYGVPGVGKTVMAKYIVTKQINFVELRAADCTKKNSEEFIQLAFKEAKSKKPCLLLIDELDKIAGGSDDYYMEMNDKAMKVLLQELDSIKNEEGILVCATCNDINRLGHALIRSGRFDRVYKINLPNLSDREKILSLYFDKIKIKKEIEVSYLARMTEGCSCAQLENFVNESAIIALSENNAVINLECFQKAMDRNSYHGIEGKVDNSSKHLIAIHEAGHCLAQLYLKPDTVSGASIIPHGESAGRSRHIASYEIEKPTTESLNDITIMLAGKAAEMIEFGVSSAGCSDDIRKAVGGIDYLLTECGIFGYDYVVSYTRYPITSDQQFDKIVQKRIEILKEQHDKAKVLILEHKDVYNKIVTILEDKHVITRETLLGLLA